MIAAGAPAASRVLVVGSDADVSIALHLHLERAGHAVYCLPGPGELESFVRAAAPHTVVLLLPAVPDGTWGAALTTAASAARVGVRVVMVAPSREIVEPLAAVAGAERALARAEVLSRPLVVMERLPGSAPPPAPPNPPPPGATPADVLRAASSVLVPDPPLSRPRAPSVDLMALIDEELEDEPKARPSVTRVEVNVSLVSEHNFYVGATRRVDSGGVFIATALPPAVGTRLQVRLGLADGRKLDLEGEVAFVREKSATTGRQPSGCGVKLLGLPGWAVDAIDRFTLARQPIVYTPR
ncbi:type IV pilus assembly PilZ [Anaeromyxobacter sp. K]|uniref:PilZ domain-containing protein n=1 Tax=Anaeromyxobacter sp. (strain K) TaxID=447217 RepID=UPI00017BE1E6|nr:PilZ domain-containing protein [Anaeromyxobacter sp. K]ACG74032.1 type IV pilus assembly PilZ [Anaeromyxobacter sp. K]